MANKSNRYSDNEKPKVTIDIEPNRKNRNYKKIVGGILIFVLVAGGAGGIWGNWKTIMERLGKSQINELIENKSEVRIAELESQIAEMHKEIKNIREGASDDDNNERVDELENKVTELAKIMENLNESLNDRKSILKDDKQAVVIALGNLQNAIVNGRQFVEPLILAKLIINDERLNEISGYAEEGVASVETLKHEFEKLQNQGSDPSAVVSVDESEKEEVSGVFNRLLDSTRSYVRIGAIESIKENRSLETNEIYRSLGQGDLDEAMRLWNKINENDKNILKQWGKKLKDRIKVENTINELILTLETPE